MKKILVVHAIELENIDFNVTHAEVRTIYSGIGKTNAAMHVMKAALEFQPDYVINIGSAGTFNHHVGDIIVSHHFVDRDLERMKLFGLAYDIQSHLPEGLHLQSVIDGKSVTGDFIVNTGDDFVTAGEKVTGDVVDMEAFAEAMVCQELNLPLVSVKYVTDVVGQNSVELWEEKLADARKGLRAFFEENKTLFT